MQLSVFVIYALVQCLMAQGTHEGPQRRANEVKQSISDNYNSYKTIYSWMKNMSHTFSNVEYITIGKSINGIEIPLIKITSKLQNNETEKKCAFFVSGFHGREWIAPASTIFVMEKILNEYEANNPEILNILQSYNLYFLPLANPDGYDYTNVILTDYSSLIKFYWYGNRKFNPNGRKCTGINLNRNFGYHFKGHQNESCDLFGGNLSPFPFSEPETAAIRDFVMGIKEKRMIFMDVHCCRSNILIPWSHQAKTYPSNHLEMLRVTQAMKEAFEVSSNATWGVGSAADKLFENHGGSLDWMKGVAGFEYSMVIELHRNLRDSSIPYKLFQFVPLPSAIKLRGKELYVGILAAFEAVENGSENSS